MSTVHSLFWLLETTAWHCGWYGDEIQYSITHRYHTYRDELYLTLESVIVLDLMQVLVAWSGHIFV